MLFRSLFDGLKSMSARHWATRQRPVTRRLTLEALEDRAVPASLSVGDVTLLEGNVGTQYASVPVTLSAPSAQTVTVNFRTADGTAKVGSDYDAVSGTLTFAPGQMSKSVLVPVRGDTLAEPDETFSVKLRDAKNAKIADGTGVVTIRDDGDGRPRRYLFISDAQTVEGSALVFTVTLDLPSTETITVSYGDQPWLGQAGTLGTLTFAPGETTKTITLETYDDNIAEATEYVNLYLFDASPNAVIADGLGEGVISDNDGFNPTWGGDTDGLIF